LLPPSCRNETEKYANESDQSAQLGGIDDTIDRCFAVAAAFDTVSAEGGDECRKPR
jgi:hypothetical protein